MTVTEARLDGCILLFEGQDDITCNKLSLASESHCADAVLIPPPVLVARPKLPSGSKEHPSASEASSKSPVRPSLPGTILTCSTPSGRLPDQYEPSVSCAKRLQAHHIFDTFQSAV